MVTKSSSSSVVDLAGDDVESSDDKECMLVAGVAEVARPKRLPPRGGRTERRGDVEAETLEVIVEECDFALE